MGRHELQGSPLNTVSVWPKVHPDLPINDYIGHVGKTIDRYRVEVYQIVEMERVK